MDKIGVDVFPSIDGPNSCMRDHFKRALFNLARLVLDFVLMSNAASAWFATAPLPDGISASDTDDERTRTAAREAARMLFPVAWKPETQIL